MDFPRGVWPSPEAGFVELELLSLDDLIEVVEFQAEKRLLRSPAGDQFRKMSGHVRHVRIESVEQMVGLDQCGASFERVTKLREPVDLQTSPLRPLAFIFQ